MGERGGMDGVDGTKWHLLRSCPLAPSCQGQGSQFAFTGGQRPWQAWVEFGVIRPVSSSLFCLAASPSRSTFGLSPLGPAGIRGGRGVGTRTTLGPLVQVELRPGLGGGEKKEGRGRGRKGKRDSCK